MKMDRLIRILQTVALAGMLGGLIFQGLQLRAQGRLLSSAATAVMTLQRVQVLQLTPCQQEGLERLEKLKGTNVRTY